MGQTGATYPEATRTSETARYDKLPPYLSAPADPWAGVAGDQPLRWSEDDARYWIIRANEGDCTAAHDHCLIRDAWFTEADMARDRTVYRYAYPRVFGPDAPTNPKNASVGGSFSEDQGYTAYRSVPATRANLQPGALVLVLEDKKLPYDGRQAVEASWIIGPLDRVDHDNHKLYIVGRDKPEWLSAARVVVITWRPGEKIQIVGGAKRDSLAVSAKDVFLPVPD
jgi:hypothetical protein